MIWQGRCLRVSFGENLVAELTKLAVPPSTFGLGQTRGEDKPYMKLYDVVDVLGERMYVDLGEPAFPQFGRDVGGMWTNDGMWMVRKDLEGQSA